ncbi:NADH:flavin oxidoreductase/NADH oxidase family protein [Lentilactobacillus diolivorans]|uniref:Oxidoreductase, FAD FMN-binding protein n=2 Tax=Lentilactobacillus diolivorans TaxID=179838 RepID=A0A0R1S937_9LACO|nr:NADH:flavin oxidoreductase/NADH oxidase family protein [Lentilactobacillus diolivorans]KRL65495.1 oxidoreductase, FAD FMN-binding protein [Lentilactobacillus diolivorans DSM 14421]GEP24595.1 NADH oxidoreductase [Lentilactobacillus diolivorans]
MTRLNVAKPLTLSNGQIIKNRFLKASMSETFAKNGHPNQHHINLYRAWSHGGAGLLFTGNVMIDHTALGEPGNVVVEDERDLPILKEWAKAGTENNTQFWMQINHPGKQSYRSLSKEPVAPSAIPFEGIYATAFGKPRALTKPEIKELVNKFTQTAVIAKKAGFTGVEIHAAHGYLVDQFLSPKDNQRKDEYGGSLENRMRFLIKIYESIREAVGNEFPIGMKLNSTDFEPGGFSEDDSIKVVERMADLGINLIEISGGNYLNPTMSEGTQKGSNDAYFINYARKLKNLTSVPIALTGGFRTVATMEDALANEDTELIGLARPMVLQPDMPNQIIDGTYKTIKLPRLKTHLKFLDKTVGPLSANSYYEQQMAQIATGNDPKYNTNAWSPFLRLIRMHGVAGLMPRRVKH